MAIAIDNTEIYERADWQQEDIDELLNRAWSANWSEMGCYKTTTGLWLAHEKMKQLDIKRPLYLIITSKNGKGTYYDALMKLPEFKDMQIFNVQATKVNERLFDWEFPVELTDFVARAHQKPTVVLAHYHCFVNKSRVLPMLHSLDWDFVIVDEAHRIKNRRAQWSRNIKKLRVRKQNEEETPDQLKHVMTGTGFINDPSEMWSLLNFLSPHTFRSYHAFRRTYCDEVIIGGFPKVVGIKEEKKEEFRRLRQHVGVRRKMAEVHAGIDHPIFVPRVVELNPTQRKMYNEIKRDLLTLDKQGVPISSPNVLSQLNRLRQITVATPRVVRTYADEEGRRKQEIVLEEPSSKLDEVMSILEELEWDEEARQQVVVFSNFKDPLELLKARLDKAGVSYLHMQEKHSDNERYKMWHDLFPLKQHRVFMSTLQLGGESINLTPAQYCIFLDRSWSPKDNNQAVGRIYRPGQNKAAEIIHINARNTTDQRIENAHNVKTGWFRAIFD